MKLALFSEFAYVPAGHENPLHPGVWKKVLLRKGDLQPGTIQMVNWARLPAGQSFAPHYHEDMQEVFVIVHGEAELNVNGQVSVLRRGDAVMIDAREVHEMRNLTAEDTEYLAMGIGAGTGQTVVVAPSEHRNT